MGALARRTAEMMVGSTDFHRESGRRVITNDDIRQAEAWRRRGDGWQSIAHRLQVNQIDLRMLCGDLPDPRKAQVAAAPEKRPMLIVPMGTGAWTGRRDQWRKSSVPNSVRLMAELARGQQVRGAAEAIGMLECDAWNHLKKLRRDGMVDSGGLKLTPKGWARLEVAGLAVR